MKKPVVTIFIILLILNVITGCSMPIGSISKHTDESKDSMFLIPRRILYEVDERFLRLEDFQIFIVENGMIMEINPGDRDVAVALSGDKNQSTEFYEPVETTHFSFFRVGRHIVNVKYQNKSARYDIQVTSPANGSGIGGGGGVNIIWLDPESAPVNTDSGNENGSENNSDTETE